MIIRLLQSQNVPLGPTKIRPSIFLNSVPNAIHCGVVSSDFLTRLPKSGSRRAVRACHDRSVPEEYLSILPLNSPRLHPAIAAPPHYFPYSRSNCDSIPHRPDCWDPEWASDDAPAIRNARHHPSRTVKWHRRDRDSWTRLWRWTTVAFRDGPNPQAIANWHLDRLKYTSGNIRHLFVHCEELNLDGSHPPVRL